MDPVYKDKRIEKKLVRTVQKFCKEKGYLRIYLQIPEFQAEAIADCGLVMVVLVFIYCLLITVFSFQLYKKDYVQPLTHHYVCNLKDLSFE